MTTILRSQGEMEGGTHAVVVGWEEEVLGQP